MINTEKNFTACHSVVPPAPYYEACLHESCLCSKGGDCDCFCSVVASYVRACNQHGVSILWRREGFCGKSDLQRCFLLLLTLGKAAKELAPNRPASELPCAKPCLCLN